jgi:hypothetical protein
MSLKEVDFRSRLLAFRGACGEPPLRLAPLGVSPVPLIPQESRTLRFNQLSVKLLQAIPKRHFIKIVPSPLHLKRYSAVLGEEVLSTRSPSADQHADEEVFRESRS